MNSGADGPAETIFTGGDVVTVDAENRVTEALAVRDGRIVAVGDMAPVFARRGPSTRVIDLGGRALLPGFVEPHGHPSMSATTFDSAVDVRPFGTPTAEGVIEKLRAAVAAAPAGEPVTLYGIDPLLHAGLRVPSMQEMDGYAPRNPLLLITNNGHAAYGNSLAYERAGVNEETPDPPGARFLRDRDGRLTGGAEETAAINRLAAPAMRRRTGQETVELLRRGLVELSRAGITTTSDHALSPGMIHAFAALAAEGNVPVRVRGYEVGRPGADLTPAPATDGFRMLGVKLWADGSPFVGNIAVSRPFRTNATTTEAMHLPPEHHGALNHSHGELSAAVAGHTRDGHQIAVHAHGDRAIDQTLNAFEGALQAVARPDHRWRMEHCGVIRDDQLERAAALGVTVSFFISHVYYWGEVLRTTLFDEEIAERWMASASALRAGVRFSFHNDGVVTPPDPLLNIQTAVLRLTRAGGRVLGPEQRITVEQAIRACTIDAAWQLFLDDEAGSLEPGKSADLVVLSANPLRVPHEQIAAQSVEATYRAGERVWPVKASSE